MKHVALSSRGVRPASSIAIRIATVGLVAILLAGCGSGEPEVVEPVVTTPQASLEGEWVLTRTVTASNDSSNPERAVGAVSTRLLKITRSDCETALCPGTVSSGVSLEAQRETELTQVDGGLEWAFMGTLNCLNSASGLVQVPDAYEFTQTVILQVTETSDESGVQSASKLEGTMTFSDSLTLEAHQAGCKREPIEANVEYSVVAVRATADVVETEE